ncbi:MAG: restriction endonuclease [Bacteroidota bacterium]|nr:restriction endonuclease [Bacteroidota bacterium]MDP3145861.1 restriction endonuclease [Bacteroidota bacterium]MDP3558495.1 restriction endonuclease [Bacteroidota bacterium]
MAEEIFITKASGEKTRFSENKIRKSLKRIGASEEQIEYIVNEISSKLYEGMTTKKIYQLASKLLKGDKRHLAARYHLKQAIMELGPSGYPFEKYVAEILSHQGYATKVGEVMQGNCVTHEVDVIAEKENHYYMIECKYHNKRGLFCDVKIPLYIQSRFKDLETKWLTLPKHKTKSHQGWVVTNTRFSTDAIQYGKCAGLNLIGWDYPDKKSLKEQIDTLGLYPITCLTSLTKSEKQKLIDKNIVLASEICKNEKLLTDIGVKFSRIKTVIKEANELCGHLDKKDSKK